MNHNARKYGFNTLTEHARYLESLPNFQKMSDLHDPWSAFSSAVIKGIIDVPPDCAYAWSKYLPCGDVEDTEEEPVLGLDKFLGCEEFLIERLKKS